MINIRQTALYADFMRRINWQIEQIDGVYIYIKKLPFLPAIVKIQRPDKLPSLTKLKQLAQKYRARSIIVEPSPQFKIGNFKLKILSDSYLHTKSVHIDLTANAQTIFKRFSSAKRRAVRRAQKAGVQIEISDNIDAFIKLKNVAAGFFLGFLTTRGFTHQLWNAFYPNHARVLLAYLPNQQPRKYLAGILLLYINNLAYYWMAAATKEGKKNFAPTLLVWEALRFAKKQRLKIFDFEGVYDERFPQKSRGWQGFSKFKKGFGKKSIYYPQPFRINFQS